MIINLEYIDILGVNTRVVREIQTKIDDGENIEFERSDVHIAAAVIKKLPEQNCGVLKYLVEFICIYYLYFRWWTGVT